jgi:hypothetical protein
MFLGRIHHDECPSTLPTFPGTECMHVAVHGVRGKTIATHKANITENSVIMQTIQSAPVLNYTEYEHIFE